jgi:hypothetical protein
LLIIIYILFLPPDVRTDLLGDSRGSANGSGSASSGTVVLLKENVGTVTYINDNEKIFDLPATRIYSPTSGQVLKGIPSIALRNAIFDKEQATYELTFKMEKDATKNVLLSFNVKDHNGPLSISLNGKEIFNSEIADTNPKPISLDQESLLDENTILLKVPSPGLRFWNSNRYAIENLQITADVTDYSNSVAVQHFAISKVEKENLETVRLFFYPSCNLRDVGSLKIDFNGQTIYNSVADCGTRTFAVLDKTEIIAGSNELRFYTTKGSYTMDNMYIKTTMTKPAYKTYYYDLKDEYFTFKNNNPRCGDYDGTCPSGCDESVDADCCFKRSGFWCALPTQDANDRCRFYVATDDCTICATGFYDKSGNTPDTCEKKCGDNKDDTCASGCSQPNRYYDKDCCFADNTANYWCKETPITGITDKCKASINPSECDLCPSGYINKDGSKPNACKTSDTNVQDEDYILSTAKELELKVTFVDNSKRKRVDVNINGHTFRIDTTGIEYTKIIDDYARRGTNSIEIVPVDDDVNIAELRVSLKNT